MRYAPGLLTLILINGAYADDSSTWLKNLERRADDIRPTAQELRWMEIPWINSAAAAEQIARQTNRPILYWNVDDDPLDRC